MIDTMGVIIPIHGVLFETLKKKAVMTLRVDNQSGSIFFEYYNGVLPQSWNYQVHVRFSDEKFIYDRSSKHTLLVHGYPHLRLEFSAPKILYGHNLESCSIDAAFDACFKVKDAFESLFETEIPSLKDWILFRVDSCANYILNSEEEVKNLISYLQRLDYSRRIKNCYEDTGIYFASAYSTLKMYAKGYEFKAHDKKRFLNEIEAQQLHNKARNILRVEVELKKRLRYVIEKEISAWGKYEWCDYSDWSGYLPMYETFQLVNVRYELERMLDKFLLGNGKETRVMKTEEVLAMLLKVLGASQARSFYAVHCAVITQGRKRASKMFSHGLMYRALACFRELGIGYLISDLDALNIERKFPDDFSFKLDESNKYYQLPKVA